ncbi:MAG TPA: glycosyltransferase family 39 protein [Sphingobacteriaceae bacterium]
MFYRRHKKEIDLILLFAGLKLLLHLLANSRFGFHRDELLYLALGQHLDWGYKEVPPFISAISWFTDTIFGDSVFATRLLPSMASASIILLTGLIVLALNGKRQAITVTCVAMVFSPAFLASGYLLQPVVFDQLFWVGTTYLLIKYIQTHKVKYCYWLGIVAGLGMLNKYTMALFLLALFLGLLLTPQRKMLWSKHWLTAFLLGFIIFLPNLVWQFANGLPVVQHMRELKETQLNFIHPTEFILQNFLVHATVGIIPLAGLIYILVTRRNHRFRFIGFSFIFVVLSLLLMQGKVYYGFGAFPMLFACGGLAFQTIARGISLNLLKPAMVLIAIPCIVLVPVAIPVLPINTTLYFLDLTLNKTGIDFPLKWEDQQLHATTQDYADMFGWQEMAEYSAKAYQIIPQHERNQVTIFADNYGQAGAVDHLGKPYGIPKTVCLNSSFALWAPDSIKTNHLIYIDNDISELVPLFKEVKTIGEVRNPLAREKGTKVYLLSYPLDDINKLYLEELQAAR